MITTRCRFRFLFAYLVGLIILVGILNSHSAVGQSGHELTTKEKKAVDKFRPLVVQMFTKDYMKVDSYLLRWVKGANFDIRQAVENFEKFYKWRKANNIDNILEEDFSAHKRYLPYRFYGYDREGTPIMEFPLGKWQLRKYAISGRRNIVTRQWFKMLEEANEKVYETSKQTGQDHSQVYYLQDYDGYTLREQGCLACTPILYEMARALGLSQPYLFKNATLVNTPRVFLPLLQILIGLVPDWLSKTANIYAQDKENWAPLLLKDVEPKYIPTSLGGTRKN